jgi:fluoroacetyl-CoA thioesterase
MKTSLNAGLTTARTLIIDRDRTIGFMGEGARVYATPMLVRDIELTCRDLLLAHLDPGEDSVGTRVEIDHLAATLLGMSVTLSATIAEVKGRAVLFEVTGRDPLDQICRCRHARFIVDVEKTKERLLAKAEKAKLAA